MSKEARFAGACHEVLHEYYKSGVVRDETKFKKGVFVTLKSPYSTAAYPILPFLNRKTGRLFFKDQIMRACVLSDLYVNEVISQYK